MMDYFYNTQAEQFASVEIPKELLTGKSFSSLSASAKMLYAVLLDRMREAKRHNWYDEENRVYIIYPLRKLEEIYPDMTKLYICKSQWGFDTSINETYIDIISVKEWLMTEERCKIVHDKGKKFSAWWLDSEESIKRAIDMGVDGP